MITKLLDLAVSLFFFFFKDLFYFERERVCAGVCRRACTHTCMRTRGKGQRERIPSRLGAECGDPHGA